MGVKLGLGAYVCITLCIALFQCKASELHYERMQLLTKMSKAITMLGRLGFLAKLPISRHQGRSPSREIYVAQIIQIIPNINMLNS